jgi:hypothetical protein
MIRIDENSYIDDTLVTCAEYQLFIDEMREQGKYYQPDHWISYQFPEGAAREPILGVLSSDAAAFCEWLTQREDGRWLYRTAYTAEAMAYPLKPRQDLIPIGYWIVDVNSEPRFTWIGSAPVDARTLNSSKFREQILKFDISVWLPWFEGTKFDREIERIINGARIRFIDIDYGHIYAIERARARPLHLDLDREFIKNWDGSYYHDTGNFEKILYNILMHIHIKKPVVKKTEFAFGSTDTNDIDKYLETNIDLLVDIFTLHERISISSPAFEGIRIVKERKKEFQASES